MTGTGSRLLRLIAAAVLVTVGTFEPRFVRQAAAVDCNLVFCGTLEIVPSSGAGAGRVTSDPSGIDCTWTPSGRSGACVYQFSWPHFVTTGIDVDLYMDPDGHSYVCQGLTCGGLDQTVHRVEHLNPGDNFDVFMVFNLGNKTTVSIRGGGGTGAGRVTTNPSGLDCRIVAGVESGTCSYDYWYLGNSYSVTLHRNPDAGSYACSGAAPFCGTPDTDYVSTLGMSPGSSGPPADFWLAVPVTVTITGSGTVASAPAGISCPSTCSKWFPPDVPPDDSTKLTATPVAGWYVKDWTGTACGATTEAVCTFYNGYSGASVGVVFARLSTPAPSATPRPTATPKPTAKPTAHPTPVPTAAPGSTPASEPASTAGPTEPSPVAGSTAPSSGAPETEGPTGPGASPLPGESVVPATSGAPEATPAATATLLPSDSPAAGGVDPTVLVLLLVIAVLTLFVGFLLGRRRAPARPGANP